MYHSSMILRPFYISKVSSFILQAFNNLQEEMNLIICFPAYAGVKSKIILMKPAWNYLLPKQHEYKFIHARQTGLSRAGFTANKKHFYSNENLF